MCIYSSPDNCKIKEHTFTRLPKDTREMNAPMIHFAIKKSREEIRKVSKVIRILNHSYNYSI